MLNPTRARVIAAIAVISAIASPAGSARPLSDPPLPTSSHTLAASGRSAPSPQVVRPNPDQQVQPASASGVPPILRRARPSELAVIDRAEAREEGPLSHRVPSTARYSTAELNAYHRDAHPVAVSAPAIAAPGGGFHWGDAAVGAGGGIAIAILAGALTAAGMRRRSATRTRTAAPVG
jgi:hypothetical protein